MSPTKIEYANETLNPQGWGCWGPGGTPDNPQRCWYCYAWRMARRHLRKCESCYQFIPHWHEGVIGRALSWKKPRRIFWQDMGDLFHPCTPREEIDLVLTTIKYTAQHTHIFLTKNPARYQEFNPWPENCWLGATITNQEDADSRTQELFKADARIKFLSAEPLLGEIYLGRAAGLYVRIDQSRGPGNLDISIPSLRWLIIGATTGPGSKDHKPKPEWVQSLIDQARAAGVALFLKDNLNWPEKIQEYPH